MFQYWSLSVISVQVSLVIISYQCSGVSTGHYQLSAFRTGILSSQVPSTLASPSCILPRSPKTGQLPSTPPATSRLGASSPRARQHAKYFEKETYFFEAFWTQKMTPKAPQNASQIDPTVIKTTSGCRSVFDIDFGCILEGPKPRFQCSCLHATRFLTFYAGHENSSKLSPKSI